MKNKLYVIINELNHVLSITNESNRDMQIEKDGKYIIIESDLNYESFFPLYKNDISQYKIINNQIVEKSIEEKQSELQLIEDDKNDFIIKEKLLKNDLSIIRAILENDSVKIEAHKLKQAQLRNQLKKKG